MNKMFNLKRTSIVLSLKCNLKCKLCAAYSPYYEESANLPVSVQMDYVKKYFEIVDHVEQFTISGGEPLLYKNLPDFLDKLSEYSDRFDKLEIITNGTIVPSKELINCIKPFGSKFYRFLVDNYDKSSKIPEIRSVLDENNIPYIVRDYNSMKSHCDGWVDFGKPYTEIHNEDDAAEIFGKCSYPQKLKFLFSIYRGIFTPCAQVRNRLLLNQNVSDGDYIDLLDDTPTVEDKRNKILSMYATNYLETCKYCNGICDDSPRFTPAEQLTSEEILKIRQHSKK